MSISNPGWHKGAGATGVVTTWEERMASAPIVAPRFELVSTLFRVQGASRRPLRCALYRVETGVELRLEYEGREDDLQRSQLFTVQANQAIAELADQWHMALREKGFWELPINPDSSCLTLDFTVRRRDDSTGAPVPDAVRRAILEHANVVSIQIYDGPYRCGSLYGFSSLPPAAFYVHYQDRESGLSVGRGNVMIFSETGEKLYDGSDGGE